MKAYNTTDAAPILDHPTALTSNNINTEPTKVPAIMNWIKVLPLGRRLRSAWIVTAIKNDKTAHRICITKPSLRFQKKR